MVAYQPPDSVVLMVGASVRSDHLLDAARRMHRVVSTDIQALGAYDVPDDVDEEIEDTVETLERYLKDAFVQKNDTSLQMAEMSETLVRIRAWLAEFRHVASINLMLDAPALASACSWAADIADPYPRDVLEEFRKRLQAAKDLRPRCEEVGLNERFLGRGRSLCAQLETAIGDADLDATSLKLSLRRHYMRKGALLLLLKRLARIGQHAFRSTPQKAELYHTDEVEPIEALNASPSAGRSKISGRRR